MAGHGGLVGFRDLEPIMSAVVRGAAERAIRPREIDRAAADLPNSAALLRNMMIALGLEPDAPAVLDHAVMAELREMCATCEHKTECARDLAEGRAAENFYAYCPNARALDSIYVEMTFNRF